MDMLNSADAAERCCAVIALGESGDPTAATTLAQVFRDDPDLGVRIDTARALGNLGGPAATHLLLEKAASNDASLVRVAALDVIEKRKDIAAIPGLVGLWRKSDGPDDGIIHIGALRALVKIGRPAVPELLNACGDSSPRVREFALEVLQKVGDRTLEDCIAPLSRDPDSSVRQAADRALSEIMKRST